MSCSLREVVCVVLIAVGCSWGALAASAAGAADSWPQWGGPARDFTVPAESAPEPWPDQGPAKLWERSLGPGYSAIISKAARLFTMTRRGEDEVVVALSSADGGTVWEHVYAAPVAPSQALDTSYGAGPNSTPLLVGERLYALGFTGILHCLDAASGGVLWRHDLGAELGVRIPFFGHSSSPVRFENLIVVIAGGAHAFDLVTGELVWKNREFAASYASPTLTRRGQQDLLVVGAAGEIVGLDPRNGDLLWRHEHANDPRTILSSPVAGDDELLFASAYFLGSVVLELAEDGRGVTELWETPHLQLSQNNSVRVGDILYGFHNSVFVALDLGAGEIVWRERGFRRANIIRAGDRFLLHDRYGKLSLVALEADGPRLLAETQLLEGRSWTAPTLVGQRLYVRNLETIAAWDLARPGRPEPVASATTPAVRSLSAPPEFRQTAEALIASYRRGDREGLETAAARLEPWREDEGLGVWADYYLGFGAYQRALLSPRGRGAALLRRAEEHLGSVLARDKSFAEAHALLARIYPTYWRFDRGRASIVAALGDEHMAEALRFEPDNPLVMAIRGVDLFYSPPEYGGDPEQGLAVLARALERFAEWGAPAEDSPGQLWGHASAWLWYGELLQQHAPDQREKARQAFERALELAPALAAARAGLGENDEPGLEVSPR